MGPRNHVLVGVEIPTKMGNFGGLSGLLKSTGILCFGVPSKINKSILHNSMTPRLL